ncbi:MAG: hypothetical protein AAGA92_02305 [Planctomycetota bacterium]
MPRLSQFCLVLAFLCSCMNGVPAAGAQELRIETEVFLGDSAKALAHTVTLFQSGTVYHFADKPETVSVFRRPVGERPGRFILLNPEAGKRTEVTTDKIDGLITKLNAWSEEQSDPLLQFACNPEFEESFDKKTRVLTLKSELWEYRVATIDAEGPTALARYREFADWYSRLNTMLYSTLPPGPRLALNAAMEERGVLPVEIRRKVQSEAQAVRAVHQLSWRLSRPDRTLLEEARQHLATFDKVDNQSYLADLKQADVVRGQSE